MRYVVEETDACVDIDCLRGRRLRGMVGVIAVDKRIWLCCRRQSTAV